MMIMDKTTICISYFVIDLILDWLMIYENNDDCNSDLYIKSVI